MTEDDKFNLEDILGDAQSTLPTMPAAEPPTEAEFMGESGVVTGKARMEAAYGTGDGEGQGTAIVAQSVTADAGTIFHQIYRPWRGKLNPRWVRNWSILRHHVYGLFSG
ncbi:MAG: hypothetical protein VX473_00380, partial [Candidatus Thermoplasmatota archaeon]|nr:hypothetical protein [Candidatus Thermoplasmatota archaeon]